VPIARLAAAQAVIEQMPSKAKKSKKAVKKADATAADAAPATDAPAAGTEEKK
jgi:hypothetical protein